MQKADAEGGRGSLMTYHTGCMIVQSFGDLLSIQTHFALQYRIWYALTDKMVLVGDLMIVIIADHFVKNYKSKSISQ